MTVTVVYPQRKFSIPIARRCEMQTPTMPTGNQILKRKFVTMLLHHPPFLLSGVVVFTQQVFHERILLQHKMSERMFHRSGVFHHPG